MEWTYALVNLALSEHASPSVSTSVGNKPAGTLYDGTHDEPVPIDDTDQLVTPSVSTISSSINSTYTSISPTITSILSTLLTNNAVSTNTTVLSRHSFRPLVSATSNWDTSFDITKRTWPSRGDQNLWVWPQPSLAGRQRSLRQSEDQWLDLPSNYSSVSFYSKAWHRRVWSFVSTVGGLDVPTGQQLVASKACSWSWSLPDLYGRDRNGCLHNGAFDAAQNPRSRPGPGLTQPSQAGWEIDGQDQQYQICSPTNRRRHP